MKKEKLEIHGQEVEVEISPSFNVLKKRSVLSFLSNYLTAKTAPTRNFRPKIPKRVKLAWENGKVSLLSDATLDFTFDSSKAFPLQAECEITSSHHLDWFRERCYSSDVFELIA